MEVKIALSHVALLLPNVSNAGLFLKNLGLDVGPEEVWDGEGTKEIYVGYGQANALLLMEPVKEGAYQRAMSKRGPGVHHFAIDVSSMDSFVKSISGSGWLLHPISISTFTKLKTIYLARPGFPGLIEVHEKSDLNVGSLFIEKISVTLPQNLLRLLEPIGLENLVSSSEKTKLSINGQIIELDQLL